MPHPRDGRPHGRLRLLLCMAADRREAWAQSFATALPEADIVVWPERAQDPDYVAVWRPPADLLASIGGPRAIFNLGAGVDALLALPNLPRDVPLVRVEDAGMGRQMAEYVTLAVLAAQRRRDAYAMQQRQARWHALDAHDAQAFGVGFLGLGVLARACIDALRPFGYPLFGWSRTRKEMPGVAVFAGDDELDRMLSRSHVLVCLLPSTDDTRDLLDARRLGALPRGAHVVNIARGNLVVEADLLTMLDSGHLEGATLDVFREEPLPPAHPFWKHPRIVITPHVSAVTLIEPTVAQVASKIRRLEQGASITGVIDHARGY